MKYIFIGYFSPNHQYKISSACRILKLLLISIICFFIQANTPIYCQDMKHETGTKRKISGIVIDAETGDPLPGVNIKVYGLSIGSITDVNGKYLIHVPQAATNLEFSMIGFNTEKVNTGNKSFLNVRLSSKTIGLNDVVVIGYGTQKKISLSAAVSSLKGSDLENQVTGNTLTALAGQIAGLDVQQNTGMPGDNPVIRIRGTGSLGGDAASNAPLYVVDGMPLADASDFNGINPNDIESVNVLKDAAASAIYGARGGNGVILITTKKGKSGNPKVNFSYYRGIQNVTKKIEMLNRDQFIQFEKEITLANWISQGGDPNVPNGERTQSGYTSNYNYPTIFDSPVETIPNTDWQNEIFRKDAGMSNYQFSVQGGSDKLKYFVSGNYFLQDGIVKRTDFTRYSGRLSIDLELSKTLNAGVSFTPTYTIQNRLPTDGHFNANNGEAGTISSALALVPFLPAHYEDGLYGQVAGMKNLTDLGFATIRSPLQAIEQPEYRNAVSSNRYFGTTFIEYEPIAELKLRSSVGVDYKANVSSYYHPSTVSGSGTSLSVLTPEYPESNPSVIKAVEEQKNYMTLNWDNTLVYSPKLKRGHNLTLLGGYSILKFKMETTNLTGLSGTYLNDLVPYPTGATTINGTYSASEYALISMFGRINYGYKDKYLFAAALRDDASSRFPKGHRHGLFPSVSGAWRISEESWFKATNFLDFMNQFKARVSYGVTGNYPSNPYPYQASLNRNNYNFNNLLVAGYSPSKILNEDLTWETNKQFNAGVDIAVLNSKLNITIDYYLRSTTGLLYTVPIPAVSGFTKSFGNIGEIQNKGLEIEIATVNVTTKKFKWTSDFNISWNQNKVVHLGLDDADVITTGAVPLTTILRVGQPMGMFYGYRTAGIFLNQADVDNNPKMKFDNNSGPGDTKFVDTNNDGIITPSDRVPLANPRPDFSYGFKNSFKYRAFNLDVQIQGVKGGKILFLMERFLGENLNSCNQLVYSTLNRWKSESEPGNGLVPRAYISARGKSVGLSESSLERWLYDGSYLNIQNVTLGYRLPYKIIKKIGFSSVQVYTSGQNLWTFSDYIGYSPYANSYGENATISSVDYGTYPQARTIIFGVKLGL